jgi:hypothetical protein
MTGRSPGVRRLCVGTSAQRRPGLLGDACRAGGLGGLYAEHIPAERLDLAFASPGIDEAVLVTDLLVALRSLAEGGGVVSVPAVVAFHVGITQVEGDSLGGAAVTRIRALIRDLSVVAAASARHGGLLVAGISDGLFEDIAQECGLAPDWVPLETARAWFRVYRAGHGGVPHLDLH